MSLLSLLGVLSSAIFSGTSLLYATLGEVITERSGTVNLGLEGVLLISAATGYGVTVLSGNPFIGVLAAMLAGGCVNLIFGFLVVSRKANQLASGLAVLFFGYGLSALIGKPFVGKMIKSLPRYEIPGLENLPLRFSSLFKFDLLIYLVIPIAFLVWFLLYRTRWGLGVRSVGENAETAYASGRNPGAIKYQALFVGGLLIGLGAAHLSIAFTKNWAEYMTAGRGFIAIALVIFSKWHPIRAIAGVLVFSGAVAFQLLLQVSGVNISPFILDMIPFVLTLAVLLIWGGTRKHSAPAMLGRVYQGTE
jgi:general nucleoside transport system permease protein